MRSTSPLSRAAHLRGNYTARRGYVARVDDRGSVGWAHWTDADGVGDPGELRLRKRAYQAPVVEANPIPRRDPLARVESLTRRLVDEVMANPGMYDHILTEIQGEYWKAGAPVSVDQLRDAARILLERAERAAMYRDADQLLEGV